MELSPGPRRRGVESFKFKKNLFSSNVSFQTPFLPMTMANAAKPEDVWIDAAQKGSRDAFDALIDLHGRGVLRYVEGVINDRIEAEDLAQEARCQAYRRLETFKSGT